MSTNPKDYRLRFYLPNDHDQAMPHLLDIRPRRMSIKYSELAIESQVENIDYYGLWVQRNVYRTVETQADGKPGFVDLITKGNYSYVWEKETGLPIVRTLSVYNCFRDGSFDLKFEVYPNHLVTFKERNCVLVKRRSQVKDTMIGEAIRLGIGEYVVPFFKKHLQLTNNYIESGNTELLDTLKVIQPLPEFDPEQQNWMFSSVPDSESILAGLNEEQKMYLELDPGAVDLTVKEVLLLNFWMATLIPSAAEIATYLVSAGVG